MEFNEEMNGIELIGKFYRRLPYNQQCYLRLVRKNYTKIHSLILSVSNCMLNRKIFYEYFISKNKPYPINLCEIRVIGMKRAGNHAIINWLGHQNSGKRVYFLNNIEPKTNPFITGWHKDGGERLIFNNFRVLRSQEIKGHFLRKDCLIYNYEDCFLEDITNKEFEQNREKWVGSSAKKYDVLILRDPFNMFASRVARSKYDKTMLIDLDYLRKLWKQYAKEFLGKTNILKQKITFNFNLWVLSKEYRINIAKELRLAFSDNGLYETTPMGGGSSFEYRLKFNPSERLKTLERYKVLKADKRYRNILKDEELINLSREIFGEIVRQI